MSDSSEDQKKRFERSSEITSEKYTTQDTADSAIEKSKTEQSKIDLTPLFEISLSEDVPGEVIHSTQPNIELPQRSDFVSEEADDFLVQADGLAADEDLKSLESELENQAPQLYAQATSKAGIRSNDESLSTRGEHKKSESHRQSAQIPDWKPESQLHPSTANPSVPFYIRISGKLSPVIRDRLVGFIQENKMGFRPTDLELPLDKGEVLLTQINETALIYLSDILKDSNARIEAGLMEEHVETARVSENQNSIPSDLLSSPVSMQAEDVVLLTTSPPQGGVMIIDTITASLTLSLETVEVEQSTKYQNALDALQLKLKFLAFRKGATHVYDFKVHLTPLSYPTRYKLTVFGTAVNEVESESSDIEDLESL